MKHYTQRRLHLALCVLLAATVVLAASGVGNISPLLAAPLHRVVAQSTENKPPSGVGRIELIDRQQVVLMVGGIVDEVAVEPGDQVQVGDLLVSLDTQQLEWAVKQAEMGLESAQLGLAKLNETVEPYDVALAEANLLQAKENMAVVEQGSTEEEMNAAKNSAAAAWAAYNDLKAGPTAAQLTQARAGLQQAEINLKEAQRAYDKIAWMPEAGTTPESAALQQATISYESAKAGFEETNQPAKQSALLGALSGAQSAQNALNELEKKPLPSELAAAKATLAQAEATLAKMKKGPNQNDVRQAELGIEQALIGVEQAKRDLKNARLTAPISGTVLAVAVEPGEQASAGSVVVTLADTSQLKLVVNVEQKDIRQIKVGQETAVSVYALPDRTFKAVVEVIVPVSDASTGLVTYPVTLRLTDESLEGLLPGMTATAVFSTTKEASQDAKAAG